jgi:hypothetical protein
MSGDLDDRLIAAAKPPSRPHRRATSYAGAEA